MAGRMTRGGGPSAAYLGTDQPEPGFMQAQALEPGQLAQQGASSGYQPNFRGAPVIPPIEEGSVVPSAEQLAQGQPGQAQQIIADAAANYMNIQDIDALDDAAYEQLLAELEQGYPDDQALIGAIQEVRAGLGAAPQMQADMNMAEDAAQLEHADQISQNRAELIDPALGSQTDQQLGVDLSTMRFRPGRR